jgi:hypothetical protein
MNDPKSFSQSHLSSVTGLVAFDIDIKFPLLSDMLMVMETDKMVSSAPCVVHPDHPRI